MEKKQRKEKNDGTDGLSITADNGASLKPVGLAAFLRSLLREDSLALLCSTPASTRLMPNFSGRATGKVRAVIEISYLDARYARAPAAVVFYLPSFLSISISPGIFLPRGAFEHNGTFERKECISSR